MGVLGIVGNAQDPQGYGRYEPKRKNHFVVDFEAMSPGSHLDTLLQREGVKPTLRATIQTISRPTHSFEGPIELKHGNETWKVAGNSTWSMDVTATFHDVIPATLQDGAGDVDPMFSPSAIFYDWQNLIQDITTGAGGLSVNYKSNIIVSTLAPDGSVIEKFVYHGAFPKEVQRGDHGYDGSDALTLNVSFVVDKIYRVGLTDTTPPAENTSVPAFSATDNEIG